MRNFLDTTSGNLGFTDITNSLRVVNGEVDLGPYENHASVTGFDKYRDVGSWSVVDWFGVLFTPSEFASAWIYHIDHSWLYIPHDQSPNSIWLWDAELGWVWTNADTYPILYHNNSGDWIYFHKPNGLEGAFYYYKDGSWAEPQTINIGSNYSALTDAPLEMIWVEPGSFMMGSPESEPQRDSDETQHQVTLTKGFWLGKFEVTQAQWLEVMSTSPSYFTGDNLPVEQVHWGDAKNFCLNLLNKEALVRIPPTGYTYNLPTEAQWEYACRAGTTTATAYGDSLSSTQANFHGDYPYNGGADGPYLGKTTNVGSYAANAWGFHDMHGNVAEWIQDTYGSFPSAGVLDPIGPAIGSYRVPRGGN